MKGESQDYGMDWQWRRRKDDNDGRDYKCHFCEKTYLSYSAMYTHMKTKHSKGPDGKPLFLPSGWGRGRPKKNTGRVTNINPECEEYFRTIDKTGGPVDPYFDIDFPNLLVEVHRLNSADWKVYQDNPKDYPLIELIKKYSFKNTPGCPDTFSKDEALDEYKGLSEEWKYFMNCDEVFCVYLWSVSQKVNKVFYQTIVKFMILYWECINKYGWRKKEEWDRRNGIPLERKEPCDFSTINNAELCPDVSNEMVTIFLDENPCSIERCDIIDMTWNFCHWLYLNSHTCSRLSFMEYF